MDEEGRRRDDEKHINLFNSFRLLTAQWTAMNLKDLVVMASHGHELGENSFFEATKYKYSERNLS